MRRFEVRTRSLALLLCVYAAVSNAQNGSSNRFSRYEEVLKVSANDNFYISGETIQLAIFCLNKLEKTSSSISKVAYITLLDEDKNIVHQSKTKLSKGRGASEIFVKSSYPTGNYYLVAHTALMLNQETSDLSVNEISIVNPFTPYQNPSDSLINEDVQNALSGNKIQISLPKKTFGVRDKIRFTAQSQDNSLVLSNLVIQRKSELTNSSTGTAQSSLRGPSKDRKQGQYKYLPDVKGELLSGYLTKIDSINFPTPIYITFPGKEPYLIATELANPNDTFHVTIPGEVVGSQVSLTVPNCKSCQFNLIEKFISDYDFLEPKSLVLSKDQLAEIEQRSIKSQISNAFSSATRPTDPTKFDAKFYGTPDKIYYLSDYTAFSKIEEIFREITTNISLRKEGASYTLRLFGEKREVIESPLILMNGRIIEDVDYIVNFDVSQIERIETVSERFHLGEIYVDGIISFFLKNNSTIVSDERKNFDHLPVDDLPITKSLTSKAARTPAYNRVLYWNPFVQFENGKVLDFNFESGDDKGIFQITFETLDQDGNLNRSTEEFEIK